MQVTTVRSDGCLSFVLADGLEAAVVDPTKDTAKLVRLLAEKGLRLRFVIDTHTHADHLSGARKLADETGARLVMSARHAAQWSAAAGQGDALGIGDILRANAGVRVDLAVKDGDTLELGAGGLRFVAAPGHTLDSLVVVAGDRAFTGDTLHIGQVGRCDLPGGDGAALRDTLTGGLAALPDDTLVYPGHDYQGQTVTALGFERVHNPFLKPLAREAFLDLLRSTFPTLTGAGMQCGAASISCAAGAPAGAAGAAGAKTDPLRDEVAGFMDAYFFAGNRPQDVVSAADLGREIEGGAKLCVLDVREPSEYESGHVAGAYNFSVHQLDRRLAELPAAKDERVVTICRSGKRSGWAAMFLRVAGYRDVRSVPGGMLAWTEAGRPAKTGAER